jgi:amino acid transporter
VLYASRLPYAMARDGWPPSALARTSQRTGVPTVALVATCLVSALCAALPFGKLVVLDILVYSVGLALEFAALMVLRIRRPDLACPSRVPSGRLGLAWATLAPLMFATVVTGAAWRGEGARTPPAAHRDPGDHGRGAPLLLAATWAPRPPRTGFGILP